MLRVHRQHRQNFSKKAPPPPKNNDGLKNNTEKSRKLSNYKFSYRKKSAKNCIFLGLSGNKRSHGYRCWWHEILMKFVKLSLYDGRIARPEFFGETNSDRKIRSNAPTLLEYYPSENVKIYLIIVQRDATWSSLLFCKFTLHVSGVNHVHQQYTKL